MYTFCVDPEQLSSRTSFYRPQRSCGKVMFSQAFCPQVEGVRQTPPPPRPGAESRPQSEQFRQHHFVGKPHMRVAAPGKPIIKSPTTAEKRGRPIGRPPGSKSNKEKKKIKLASQESAPKPAHSSQTDVVSSSPSMFQTAHNFSVKDTNFTLLCRWKLFIY